MKIEIYRETDNPLPEYQNKGDAGLDIRSNEDVTIRAFSWTTIGTGLYIIIPFGYEGQMRSRSGLAAKHGVHVLNSPGTIDSGYRDEVKVIVKLFISINFYSFFPMLQSIIISFLPM